MKFGEYIEIATINPTTNSSNYNFLGTIMAQVSQNIQVLDIKVGIRYSELEVFLGKLDILLIK